MGGPGPPQGSRGWSLLGVIASRGGTNAQCEWEERRGQGLCFPSPPLLWRGGRLSSSKSIAHWETVAFLHPLPSLRSVSASHIPCSPLWLPQGPLHSWGHIMACKGQHCAHTWAFTFLAPDTPPEGGGEGMKPAPRGGWHCPGPASRLWHCPDSSFAPLGLTPHAGQILPATPPCPTPCLSPSWPQAFPKTACAWAPCPPASPHKNGPGLCLLSGGGAAV